MYTGKDFTFKLLWHFARKNLCITFLISLGAVLLYTFLEFKFIAIPFVPIASVGTAVAFYARPSWSSSPTSNRNLTSCQ